MSNDNQTAKAARLRKMREALDQSSPTSANKPRQRKPKPYQASTISIGEIGDNNVVGNGNTVNNFHNVPPPRPQIHIQSGVGTLDGAQKGELLKRLHELAELEIMLRKTPKTFQAVVSAIWKKLNNAMGKVNATQPFFHGKEPVGRVAEFNGAFHLHSYHDLHRVDYPDAECHLLNALGVADR